MKNLVIVAFMTILCCSFTVEAAQTNSITWTTNYEEATVQARNSNKPLFLFFTGSDWCTWCQKLEKEVLDTQEFAREAGNKFIFVRIDTPFNNPLPKKLTDQNTILKKRFDIRSFPTVVILNSQEKQIGTTGYRQGGPKAYVQHLDKIVGDFSQYNSRVDDLGKKKLSGLELKKLYSKAKELGRTSDAVQIIQEGIETKDNHFFLIEHYRHLVSHGQQHDDESVTLRQRILSRDPKNRRFTHYQVAVIDFEAACNRMEKENIPAESIVAPLISYIDKFGTKDPENLWRLEMIVSQVYFDKGDLAKALQYAQASYDAAPSSVQPDISTAIKSIQSQLAAQ